MKTERFWVPAKDFELRDIPTDSIAGLSLDKDSAKAELAELLEQISEEQVVFHAAKEKSVLFVLQGMDTSGKDGTIKKVFATSIHPLGIDIANFKKPSTLELSHDYLWRVHQKVPRFGHIGVFNRSHYEDVLITQVEGIVSQGQCRQRYEHIKDFERMLSEEGVVIRKIYLHISPEEQRERLQERIDRPDKHWKFNIGDLVSRKKMPDYINAYNEVLAATHTSECPWYIVPSDKKWLRNLVIAKILLETLKGIDSEYPELEPEAVDIEIPKITW